MKKPQLEVKNIKITFLTDEARVPAVRDVSFNIAQGETLCLIGESGCGKSVTALSIMGLIPQVGGIIESGEINFNQQNILAMTEKELINLRGNNISLIFQEPMTSLNPLFTIGYQMAEGMRIHSGLNKKEARARSIELLKKVDIPAPEKRLDDYPQKLSGGMRQRVMIAMAISGKPQLIIADEPTTALDVTIQIQILNILREMRESLGLSMLLITHDMGIVAEVGQRVAVMYAGKIVESATVRTIFHNPLHPYTQGLHASLPSKNQARSSRLKPIPGNVPEPQNLPPGCAFNPRCTIKEDLCRRQDSELREIEPGHWVSCHVQGAINAS